MQFLRAAAAGTAAASLLGALQVLSDAGWSGPGGMLRERAFAAALGAIVCGWLAAALVALAGRLRRAAPDRIGAAFWAGAALALAPWSPWAALPALALLGFALRGALPKATSGVVPAGAALHLAPIVVFLLAPPDTAPLPLADAPEPLAGTPADAPPVSEQRPDVLLLVADTLRAEAILDDGVETPHLDALRARGAWAEYALAPCNQTLPSHMVLFTGLDIEKLGMRSNESRWPTAQGLRADWNLRTLAERLGAAGWRTAGVAANVLLTTAPVVEDRPAEQQEQSFSAGFEWWHGMQRVPTFELAADWADRRTLLGWLLPRPFLAWPLRKLLNPHELHLRRTHWCEGERTVDQALVALGQIHAQPAPGFLFVNLFDPHAPYDAPPPHSGAHADPARAPAGYPAGAAGEFAMRVEMYEAFQKERSADSAGAPRDLTAEAAFLQARYREEVEYADAQLGRLLDAVERGGRPTLVLFVGDHGEAFGEHRNAEHRWTLHEEEIRVPFVLAGPGVPEGLRLRQVPELVDGTRTLLEMLGLADAGVCGRNVLSSDEAPPRAPLSMMVFRASLRDARYKLIAWVSYGEHDRERRDEAFAASDLEIRPLQFFDLEADPKELADLLRADAPPLGAEAQRALDALLGELAARMRGDRFPGLPPRRMSAAQEAQLSQLGYGGSLP